MHRGITDHQMLGALFSDENKSNRVEVPEDKVLRVVKAGFYNYAR